MSVASRLRRAFFAGARQLMRHGTPMQRAITGAFADMLMGSQVYAGADANRLLADWWMLKQTSDDELRWSLDRLRRRARDLERNNPTIRSFLRAVAVNVVGPDGIHLSAQVRNNNGELNDSINTRIEDAWAEWCEDPLIGGRQDFNSFQRTMVRSWSRDGEVLIRKWRGFSGNRFEFGLEAIDPDLLDETLNRSSADGDNAIRLGVEVDQYARPVAYYLWDRPASLLGMATPRERKRIPADEIIHLFAVERQNQTRGVTELASIMVPSKMLDGYVESELVAARVAAGKMGFFQRKRDEAAGFLQGDKNGEFQMEVTPGTFGILPDGYELSTFDPHHPNSSYGSFIKDTMRRIASGLGLNYNSLASDLENVNYSSMRSGQLIEQDTWRTVQQWWIAGFLKPIYSEWLDAALLSGALKLDSRDFRKFLDARWSPRGWTWVDPLKDTQAGVLAIQSGLSSRSALLAQQGYDFEEVLEQLAEEDELAAAAGVNIAGPSTVTAPKTTDTPEQTPGEPGTAEGGGGADAEEQQQAKDQQGRTRNRVAALLTRRRAHLNGGAK